MTGPGDVALLVGYALVVLGIGAALARRGNSSESYLLADRTLGTARVFASTFATFHGTGMGYLYGVGAVGLPVAAVVGYLPVALFAPRIKALSDRQGAITLPALLADSWRPRTRALAALVTGALFSAALAVNLLAAGTAMEAVLGTPLRAGQEPALSPGRLAFTCLSPPVPVWTRRRSDAPASRSANSVSGRCTSGARSTGRPPSTS